MIEEKILKILEQIEQDVSKYKIDNVSFVSGYIGVVLFYERYSKIEPKMKSKLEKSIYELIKLSYDVSDISYSNGLSGVGWLFSYLISEKVIDVEDSFFNEIDNQIHKNLHIYLNSNNFDFLHGAIGIGMYLLERKTHSLIGLIIDSKILQSKAIVENSQTLDELLEKYFLAVMNNMFFHFDEKRKGYVLFFYHKGGFHNESVKHNEVEFLKKN